MRGLNVVSPDGNGRTGRMILFRESLKNEGMKPFIVLDMHRPKYIEGLKQYREEHSISRLAALMQIEADDYYKQCEYFMG